MSRRDKKACNCCGYMESLYRSFHVTIDGRVWCDVLLCRRCCTEVEDAIGDALRERNQKI